MTDPELIEGLAARVMGWDVHATSTHRPGDRAYPHAWRWDHPDGRRRLMVFTLTPHANREFNPLADEADARELAAAAAAHGMALPADADLATEAGRRALCESLAAQAPCPEAAAWHLWLNGHGVADEASLPPGVVALLRAQFQKERIEPRAEV